MASNKLPKTTRDGLRELVSKAWQAELEQCLTDLEGRFAAWRAGGLDPFALAHEVREYGKGPIPRLATEYGEQSIGKLIEIATYKVHLGVVSREEVPDDVLDALQPQLDRMDQVALVLEARQQENRAKADPFANDPPNATMEIDRMDLVEALTDNNDEVTWFLDKETGDLRMFSTYEGQFLDGEEDEDEIEAMDLVRIDRIESREAFGIMERFAHEVARSPLQDRLIEALNRPKPFRRFKNVLNEYNEERDQWHAFHEETVLRIGRQYLEREGVAAKLVNKHREFD